MEVSSREEEVVYHEEEDVVCSQPIELYVGCNLTVLIKQGSYTMNMPLRWDSVYIVPYQGKVQLQMSSLGKNLSAHMQEGRK